MVKFVLGPSGSGKTMWLIDRANKDKREGNGNIIFIDTDDSHIFSLDHKVRLVNAADFDISSVDNLYGFLMGILSRDYDIEKVYIDGIYDIVDFDEESFNYLVNKLEEASVKHNVDFLMGLDISLDKLPEEFKDNAVELKDK